VSRSPHWLELTNWQRHRPRLKRHSGRKARGKQAEMAISDDETFVDNAVANEVRKLGGIPRGVNPETVKVDRAALKASEVGLIRTRLGATAAGHISKAADKLLAAGDQPMPAKHYETFTRSVGHAVRMLQLDKELGALEERFATAGRLHITEERVYGEGSPHSFYRDLGAGFDASMVPPGAQERMAQYGTEVAYEIRQGSPEGQRAERAIRELCRTDDPETNRRLVDQRVTEMRAFATGGGATASATGGGGAAFVSPFFAWESLATYRGKHRTFTEQCGTGDMPPYGFQVYVPTFSTGASVMSQTEGQPVTESDPTTTLPGTELETITGQLLLSQQLEDRGFTGNGGDFDKMVAKQLQQQYDESVEMYVLSQALGSAATVSGQASFSIAGVYQDIAAGREKLTDTAGTRLRPTHFFSTSDFYSYVTRQVDSSQRPIVVPQFAPGFPLAAGDAQTKWSRFTGTVLPGGVLWFEADAIPNLGTTSETQLIVSAPDEAMVVFEGEPVLMLAPQYGAASLELMLNLRAYVAAVPRYPSGTASIAGAAYTASLV
jgi:hypothetical protein